MILLQRTHENDTMSLSYDLHKISTINFEINPSFKTVF